MIKSTTQGIDLIYKYYTTFFALPSFFEKVSHPLCSHTHKNLLKLGSCYLNKLTLSLVSQCSCKHSLPCSRWSVQKDTSPDSGSKFLKFIWRMQKIYNFSEFSFDDFSSIKILEVDIVFIDFGLHFDGFWIAFGLSEHIIDGSKGHQHTQYAGYYFSIDARLFGGEDDSSVSLQKILYLSRLKIQSIGKVPMKVWNHYSADPLKQIVCPCMTTSSTWLSLSA